MDPDYDEYKDNSKFKSYVYDFSSSLALFEKAKEWADLIKCLQRVTSIFKKYSQFPAVVPDKLVFCKRLSQCCNPALPSGVHLKTLETYEIVFERIGPTKLAKDLPFYSVGLFPLFANASMQIRPKIIDLLKTYYLPIGKALQPCLNGLVMALVPGLEETNSEFYRSIVKLLDDIGEKVGLQSLFHCLWKIISLNPSIRIGAINYMMERIPKKKGSTSGTSSSSSSSSPSPSPSLSSEKDLDTYMPNAQNLVLTAMIRAIDDPVVLVQRAVLDLLLAHFKMSEMIFDEQGLSRLVRKAILLQLRREASLNRRVYTWLLGEDATQSQEYFLKYSKRALILAINDMFQEPANTIEKAVLPFKILLALFDKPEVSAPIINEIIENIIEALQKYSEGYSFTAEIVAQVNTVLDGLKPAVIWAFLNQFVRTDVAAYTTNINVTSPSSYPSPYPPCRSLTLCGTLLDKMVGLNSFDSITKFLPEFISSLTHAASIAASAYTASVAGGNHLIASSSSPNLLSLGPTAPELHLQTLLSCLQMIMKVMGKMQQPIARGSAPASSTASASSGPSGATGLASSSGAVAQALPAETLQAAISTFEVFFHQLCVSVFPSTWEAEIAYTKANEAPSFTTGAKKIAFGPGASDIHASQKKSVPWKKTLSTAVFDVASQSLVEFYSTFWSSFGIVAPNPAQAPLHEWFEALVKLSESAHPIVSCTAIRTLVAFLNLPTSNPSATKLQSYLLHSTRLPHTMAKRLWDLLKPSLSVVHYRAASTFLELKDICSEICEETICEALLAENLETRLESHQRFALLWRLTSEIGGKRSFDRALFLMLDSLNDEQPIIKLACRTWLADSISKVERILDPLLTVLLDKSTARSTNGIYQKEYDCRRVLYAFKILQGIIECDFKLWMNNAMDKPVSKEMFILLSRQVLADEPSSVLTGSTGSGAQETTAPPNIANGFLSLVPNMPSTGETPSSSSLSSSTAPSLAAGSGGRSSPTPVGIPSNAGSSSPSSSTPPPVKPIVATDAYSFIPVVTYLDLLVVQSLRFITGIPGKSCSQEFTTKNSVTQTTAVGFLQFLLMKIASSQKASDLAVILHEPILQALAQSVSDTHLILQVNLLGLIRSIVLIDNAADSKARQPRSSSVSGTSTPSVSNVSGPNGKPLPRVIDAIGQSQLFLQTIGIGLLQVNTDFNIRFYWLDFITSCLPYLHSYAHLIVPPILQCLCDILSTHKNAHDSIESKDTLMILRGMKIILHHSLGNVPADLSSLSISSNPTASPMPMAAAGVTDGPLVSTSPTPTSSASSGSTAPSTSSSQAAGGTGFSSFFKTLFVSEGEAPTSNQPTRISVIGAVLERLDVIMNGMLKVWGTSVSSFKSTFPEFGPTLTTLASTSGQSDSSSASSASGAPALGGSSTVSKRSGTTTSGGGMSKTLLESEFSSDEIHNRYAVQDHLLALLEMIYYASPSKFLECLLREWVYVSRHPEQLLGSFSAPKLPQDARSVTPEAIERTQRHKAVCIDILNHMSNVTAESLFRALLDVLKSCHASDQQRSLRLAQAKRRGVNFTHLQDASIADMALMIVDWGNKINPGISGAALETTLAAISGFIRAGLLQSHNPHSVYQAWRILDVFLLKVGGNRVNGTLASLNPRTKKDLQLLVQTMSDVALSVLNKTFVDLSASWRMTLRFVDSYDERSDPVIMDEATLQQMKSLVALQMTLILRDHMVSVLEKTFDDSRSGSSNHVVSSIVHQLSSTIQSESVRCPSLAQESAAVMERFASAPQVIDQRTWRKEATEIFLYWSDFLRVSPVPQLRCFQKIVALLFSPSRSEGDGSGWAEFTKYLSKAVAAQTIFTGALEANIQRAIAVRRLAFILLSGSHDQYLDQLPWIQEKLVEALKQREGHADTFAAVFLCLRVMMVKIKSESMRSFWPAIISEMLTVFGPTSANNPDPELVFAVTKFLDLLLILPIEQFNIHEWMFISDPVMAAGLDDTANAPTAFVPYLDKVSNRKASPWQAPSHQQALFSATLLSSSNRKMVPVVPISKLDVNPTPLGMTWESFLQWLARYSDLQYNNRVGSQQYADINEVLELLLGDFALNKGLDPNDWTLLKMSDAPAPPIAASLPTQILGAAIGLSPSSAPGASPSVALSTSPTLAPAPTHPHPHGHHAHHAHQHHHAHGQARTTRSASASSSFGLGLTPTVVAPQPVQGVSKAPELNLVSVEDNTNATLFGDVLD